LGCTRAWQVQGHKLVDGLSPRAVDALLNAMTLTLYEPNALVAAEGSMDESIFLIKRGAARCTQRAEKEKQTIVAGLARSSGAPTVGPPPKHLATLGRGDIIGEFAMLGIGGRASKQNPRLADVHADKDEGLDALVISAKTVNAIPELREWIDQVAADLLDRGVGGLDAALIDRSKEGEETAKHVDGLVRHLQGGFRKSTADRAQRLGMGSKSKAKQATGKK
jgi:hypothetical protein